MEHSIITELSEDRLNELLAYTPSFTAENLENIKKRCLQNKAIRRKTGRRTLLAAAIAVAIISLSGIALAVSTGFDFGSFYNSLLNNPKVDEKIEVGQTIVSNGLEVTLLSAVVDRYQAYMTIEIKDLEGSRLTGSIRVLNEAFSDGIHSIITGPVIFDEDENKATLALTLVYGRNIAELGTAAFSIDTVLTSVTREGNEFLDFDLAGYANDSESISLEEWHEAHQGGGWMGGLGWASDPDAASIWEEPIRPVRPLEHGTMNVPICGVDLTYISNVGIADGFLHVQFMSTIEDLHERNQNYNFLNEHLCLVDSNDNVIDWYYCVTGDDHELMFDISDNTDFTGWRLALKGGESVIDNVIRGEWRIPFTVEKAMENRILIVYPGDDSIFSMLEIKCSPVMFSANMAVHGAVISEDGEWIRPLEGYDEKTDPEKINLQQEYINEITEYFLSFEPPYLTLNDGSRIILESINDSFDWLGGSVWCSTDYYDIETIQSITFCGEEYFFNGTP
jgi:hypothetical protein